jgi:anion-transporting  ArsA/GET3 family ATPase
MSGGDQSLHGLVHDATIVLCCGTGGVGKTTTAAALAIAAARAGRRTVVITVDPARRLASALGVNALTNEPQPLHGWEDEAAVAGGSLDALMLDSKTTFDQLVAREARTAEQAERILSNGFYRNISSALGGTQEYMAIEKLYDLHTSGNYDVVIVDTPPTRHALDVLDAPARLLRLLENPLFRTLMLPTRTPLRIVGNALQGLLRNIARTVGAEVLDDAVAFFRAFEGMESGFRERAHAVETLLGQPTTAFVVVTTLQRDAIIETRYFADRLHELGHAVNGLVINRVLPKFGSASPESLRIRAASLAVHGSPAGPPGLSDDARQAAATLADRMQVHAALRAIAVREGELAHTLGALIPEASQCEVPLFATDVHDLEGLSVLADLLGRSEDQAPEAE